MTDKERLEEIKNVYEDYKGLQKKGDFKQADIALLYLSENHIDWLIQQAERVEELELELEIETNDWRAEVQKWQKFYEESEESHLETKELLRSTIRENQRYKQALEEISNADWNSEGLDAERELDKVTDVARQALEGEGNA